MDNKLVSAIGASILCDSRVVADCYKKKHTYVVRMIKKLISDFAGKRVDHKSPLFYEKETTTKGQLHTYYLMDRHFYSHLAMRFRGEDAFLWQCKFIDSDDEEM